MGGRVEGRVALRRRRLVEVPARSGAGAGDEVDHGRLCTVVVVVFGKRRDCKLMAVNGCVWVAEYANFSACASTSPGERMQQITAFAPCTAERYGGSPTVCTLGPSRKRATLL